MPEILNVTTKDQIERGEATAATTVPVVVTKPRRSWDLDDTAPDAYAFKFTTEEGATIYCKYAPNIEEITAIQDQIVDDAQAMQEQAREFETLRRQVGVEASTLRQKEAELKGIAQKLGSTQLSLARRVVGECVMFWEGAPKPFSSQALAKLPPELVSELSQEIVNQSQLTEKEAAFLGSSGAPSSVAAPSTGTA